MSDLINRDELSRALRACLGESSGDTPIVDRTLMAIIAAVEKMPAVDAVPVVWCKDCRWFVAYEKPAEDSDGYCGERNCDADEGEFCSDGERIM